MMIDSRDFEGCTPMHLLMHCLADTCVGVGSSGIEFTDEEALNDPTNCKALELMQRKLLLLTHTAATGVPPIMLLANESMR